MKSRIGVMGFWSGMAACAATLGYDIAQFLQIAGVLVFPLDEILIYGTSFCIVLPFVLEMLALHHLTQGEKRFWTHAALLLAVVYAVFVTANYAVQLATVIPARLKGAGEPFRLLEQTPHSLFWVFDAIGYISMGVASFFAALALEGSGTQRRARLALLTHAAVTPLIGIVYFSPVYSERLLMLGAPWALTAPLFMALLALDLRER